MLIEIQRDYQRGVKLPSCTFWIGLWKAGANGSAEVAFRIESSESMALSEINKFVRH